MRRYKGRFCAAVALVAIALLSGDWLANISSSLQAQAPTGRGVSIPGPVIVDPPGPALRLNYGSMSTAAAQATEFTGRLNLVWEDPIDGSEARLHAFLVVGDKWIALEFEPEMQFELIRLGGQRVVATGDSSQLSAFPTESLKLQRVVGTDIAPGTPLLKGRLTSGPLLSGAQPWITILCRFANLPTYTPAAPSYYSGLMIGGPQTGDAYWREVSYNNINLTGSQNVVGWYNLPNPRTTYVSAFGQNLGGMARDCAALADAAVDFTSYVGINFVFNDAPSADSSSFGGGSTFTLDGVTKDWRTVWMYGVYGLGILMHETGHAFGFPHSSGLYGYTYNSPYDSGWDVMSSSATPIHTISYHKDMNGWIPPNRIVTVGPGAAALVTLDALSVPATTTNPLMIKLPIGTSPTRAYTVELRRRIGFDSTLTVNRSAAGNAVVIHDVWVERGANLNNPGAIVVDPDNNTNPNDAGANWTVGEVFSDAAAGIRVAVTAETSSSVTIAVTNQTQAPALTSIHPPVGKTAGGTSVRLTGSGFYAGASVVIGGVPATNVTVVSPTTITALTPPHAAGAVDVAVTNIDLQSSSKAQAFKYGPGLATDRAALYFGAVKSGAAISTTSPQDVTVTQTEGTAAAWTVTSSQPWVQITSGSGTGAGRFTVGIINPNDMLGASTNVTANITLTAASLGATATIPLTLNIQIAPTTSASAYGAFDTPANNAANVVGAIAVTGWALDDVGVQKVEVWRDCIEAIDRALGACTSSAPGQAPNFVFIGTAAFLPGARPDVETANATIPQSYKAGWGYLMSTNAFPHVPAPAAPQGGQGTFTLTAYAVDVEQHYTLLGTKVITLTNDAATIPFGSIDTPDQGGTVTVSVFASFGWGMTQSPKCIDPTKTTSYKVYIDGVSRTLTPGVNWFPGLTRPDIAAAYPGRCNTNNALAAYYIDSTALALTNGLHTTGWDLIDDATKVAGIGSRFFNVLIGSSVTTAPPDLKVGPMSSTSRRRRDADRPAVLGHASDLMWLAPAARNVSLQLGGDEAPLTTLTPGTSGRYGVQFGAASRMALDLDGPVTAGYQQVGSELRALPAGSTLDADAGIFAWQPPAPFLGPFQLVFLGDNTRIDVTATIVDRTLQSGVEMNIDLPARDSGVGSSFVVAGWALDPLSAAGSGIDTLHVWAYRRDGVAAPQFLGAAAIGGLRPDIAALKGEQFERTGFSLTTTALAPGVYDILVYPWSHRLGAFQEAQSVRITVR